MNCLYKELRLSAHPSAWFYLALGALTLVPAYPMGMVFFFSCLALFMTTQYCQETNDAVYTLLLPLTKRQAVRARFLLAAFLQLGTLLLSLPFALLRGPLGVGPNPVGLDPTPAYYGCGLLCYGLFNAVFFPAYYKRACRPGAAFLWALPPVALVILGMEGASHLPCFAWLESQNALLPQLFVLFGGAALYALLTGLGCGAAARRYEGANN